MRPGVKCHRRGCGALYEEHLDGDCPRLQGKRFRGAPNQHVTSSFDVSDISHRLNFLERRNQQARTTRHGAGHITLSFAKAKLLGETDYPEGIERPRKRSDCADVVRPCVFVSCRYSLYLDRPQKNKPNLVFNFPDKEPGDLVDSCALDIADRGGETLERVAELMNITRERVRQIEAMLLRKIRPRMVKMRDHMESEPRRQIAGVVARVGGVE